MWLSQCNDIISASMLKSYINTRLIDQYLQSWHTYIDNSSKASNYKLGLFKNTFSFETYITVIERKNWCPLLRFRLSNHNHPISLYSYMYAFLRMNEIVIYHLSVNLRYI